MLRARTFLVIGLIVGAIALALMGAIHPLGIVLFLPYAVVGAVLAVRRPHNPIGWLLIATGSSFLVGTVWPIASAHEFQTLTAPWFALLLVWVSSWGWFSAVAWWVTLMVIFPAGRLPGGRWRPVALAGLAMAWVGVLIGSLAPTISYNTPSQQVSTAFPNPVAAMLGPGAAPLLEPAPLIGAGLLLIALLGGAVSVVTRFRRARGPERQQLLWFVAGLLAVSITFPLGSAEDAIWGEAIPDVARLPVFFPFVFLPIAIGVAVLRYRLYDIDTIINRAVLYGGVTVAVLAVFGLANLALQNVLAGWTGGHSDLVTGFVGLALGSQYGWLRGRVRPFVDRFLPSRALLTLLFTDIVGSTERIVELGDERWRTLLGRYRAAVRSELGRYGGHEIDTAGDAFFVTFDRPAPGVRCAWAVRSAVHDIGLQLRSGVHLGECEMRGEKVSGLEVHAAARIMAAAGDDEILLSQRVVDAIGDADIETVDRGTTSLKGVPGEWRLHALQGLRSGAPPAPGIEGSTMSSSGERLGH
ncbi:MAG: adenylate/guanylate cyclase domain-containing protein [Chloroflexota bacterium]|nr:adenylate/guanylate cyclase domain-containing protein [Chloroflexota bacterium]